ncbi:MAG TPA: efflux RND transporter periplasmic adaptor subunit [bacterium]|nr:efflux RND transporter periplasmic adaptor subunit [bacterium]
MQLPFSGFSARRCAAAGWLVLAAAVLAGCGPRARAQNPAAAAPPPPAVVVTPAIARTVPAYEESVAQTIALQTIALRAQIAGALQQVAFKEGTTVRRGQTLFVIDQRPYVAALQSAQAQLATARANLTQALDQVALRQAQAQLTGLQATLANAQVQVKRDRYLVAQGAIAQQQIDSDEATMKAAAANVQAQEAVVKDTALSTQTGIEQARAGVQQAEAAVRQATLNLEYTTVQAPVDGTIGLLGVDAGNLVAVNQQLATLSTVNPIVAQFPLSEVTFLRLSSARGPAALGQGTGAAAPSFQMILADGSTYPYPGTFRAVNNAVNPQSATILAQALFPNPQGLLRPGMYTRVRVKTEDRPDTVLVPQTAVQDVQGTRTVFVLGPNNTAVLRTITDGGPYGPFFIVLSGVQAGERVIVEGIQKVRPGTAVTPTLRPAPTP